MASDIDGTLLRTDGTISPRTRAAVAAVEDAGIGFVLVTGRPPRWLAPVRDQLDHAGLAVCANGALVIDLDTEEVVQVNAFDPDVVLEVIGALRAVSGAFAFGVEWPDGFAHEGRYPKGIRQSELVEHAVFGVTDDREFTARPVAKLLVRAPDVRIEDVAPEVAAAVDGRATVTFSSTGLLEISAAGVDKAAALARLADERGVDADDVVAFGDMPNDVPMLRWAGLGVAVANAHDHVLEAADEVTGANDDDGVAAVLERLIG